MAYQIRINDEDYQRLVNASTKQGITVEELLHEAISAHISDGLIGAYRYPSGETISEALLQENERLATLIGSVKPWASDMVLEDRGPR